MFHEQSRLTLTTVVQVKNPVSGALMKPPFLDLRQRVTSTADDDGFILIDGSRQWSHYGSQFLDDARNWWVVADLSNVVDPFDELEVGESLRMPSTQRFLFQILAGQ